MPDDKQPFQENEMVKTDIEIALDLIRQKYELSWKSIILYVLTILASIIYIYRIEDTQDVPRPKEKDEKINMVNVWYWRD
jgi:hypothetical protein